MEEKEEWRLIPYNFYHSFNEPNTRFYVSNKGRIKNIKTGRILRPLRTYSGRYKTAMYYKGINYDKLIHMLVAEVFIPNPNNLDYVIHKDSDFTNNSVENLKWVKRGNRRKGKEY